MFRTHSISTAFSIFMGVVLAAALTLLVSYLAQLTSTQPSPSVVTVPDSVSTDQEEAQGLPVKDAPPRWTSSTPVEPFYVRAQGAQGPLVVYEMAGGQERFRLPAGMPSADWAYYYAAIVQQDKTSLQVFKPQTGQLEHNFTLPGQWTLKGVSPTGRWLALVHVPDETAKEGWLKQGRWETNLQIVDGTSGQIRHAIQLEGNFEVEIISTGGDSLFLIEYVPAINPKNYLVRLYDLTTAQLQPGVLKDKRSTEEVMTGLAWGGLASPNGEWLLTLYLNTDQNFAFIHALNLAYKVPFCIDLSSGQGDLEQLKAYSLALSPDGRTVYAANPALGIVAEVNLESLQVIRQTKFSAGSSPAMKSASETGPTNYSVVSKDGKRLYFTSGWDVWGYGSLSGEVKGPYWQGASLQGLALSRDERQLYQAVEGKAPLVVELGDQVAFKTR